METPQKKIVIDTNVLLYALEAEEARAAADPRQKLAWDVVVTCFNSCAVFITHRTISELERMVVSKRFNAKSPGHSDFRQLYVDRVKQFATKIGPAFAKVACKADRDDTAFLQAAAGAKADIILTEDRHLLSMKRVGRCRIIHFADFAREMNLSTAEYDAARQRGDFIRKPDTQVKSMAQAGARPRTAPTKSPEKPSVKSKVPAKPARKNPAPAKKR